MKPSELVQEINVSAEIAFSVSDETLSYTASVLHRFQAAERSTSKRLISSKQ
jgi:hypothetical protein